MIIQFCIGGYFLDLKKTFGIWSAIAEVSHYENFFLYIKKLFLSSWAPLV